MSGRKSSEVAAVLKQGEDVRKFTDGFYSREIERCYADYLKNLDAEREIKNSAESVEVALETEACEMFGAEATALATEFGALKQNLSGLAISDAGKDIISELKNLDAQRDAADREGESIRTAIRNKNWYCDDEYRRAQQLVGTYGELRDKRVRLEQKIKKLLTAENQNLSNLQAKSTRLENLAEQLKNMNVTAKKRKEADSFRAELRGALD